MMKNPHETRSCWFDNDVANQLARGDSVVDGGKEIRLLRRLGTSSTVVVLGVVVGPVVINRIPLKYTNHIR